MKESGSMCDTTSKMNCGSANNLRRFSEAFRMPPVRYGYQKSATQIDHPYYIKDWSRALWLMYYIHTSQLPMWSWIFRAKKQLGDPHSTDSRFGVWIVIDQVDVRNERHNVFIIQVVLEAKKNNTSPSHHPTALGFFKDFFSERFGIIPENETCVGQTKCWVYL